MKNLFLINLKKHPVFYNAETANKNRYPVI